MLTIVDTSVWISHFKKPDLELIELLKMRQVRMHTAILGEIIAGSIKNRRQTIVDLKRIPLVLESETEETLSLIETKHLYGKGLGWVDFQILGSCLANDCALYTHDKALRKVFLALR